MDWGIPWTSSVRTAGVLAEILTEHLLNTSYLCTRTNTHFACVRSAGNTVKPLSTFPDNSFSRIHRSISMDPERILFQLWLPHLLFFRIHCFFFRPPTKTMNRGFTVVHTKKHNTEMRTTRIIMTQNFMEFYWILANFTHFMDLETILLWTTVQLACSLVDKWNKDQLK
jgi:hypothetical protein